MRSLRGARQRACLYTSDSLCDDGGPAPEYADCIYGTDLLGLNCPAGETCRYFDDNVNYGATNFDNFGWASVQIFQTISFDGWTSAMYAVLNATGQPLVLVYFVLLIVLGGFFIVNLFLAVLFQEFTEAQAREKAIAEQAARAAAARQARRAQRNGSARGASPPPSPPHFEQQKRIPFPDRDNLLERERHKLETFKAEAEGETNAALFSGAQRYVSDVGCVARPRGASEGGRR